MSEMPAIANAFWDLRDHACDHSELWRAVDAEQIFQALGNLTERQIDAGSTMPWNELRQLLIDVLLPPGAPPVA